MLVSKNNLIHLTVQEDIKVLKLLVRGEEPHTYKVPYTNETLTLGQTSRAQGKLCRRTYKTKTSSGLMAEIWNGFTSYSTSTRFFINKATGVLEIQNDKAQDINISMLPPQGYVLCECIIPEGSDAYSNRGYKFQSDRITVIREIPMQG